MSIRVSDIFHLLNNAGVAYVVVGGVAVNLHGHTRFTKDLDLIIGFDQQNLRAALLALQSHGFTPLLPVPILDFADPVIRKQWIEQKGMVVFQLYELADTSRRIDIFVDEPLPFNVMLADAARVFGCSNGRTHRVNRALGAAQEDRWPTSRFVRH